MASESSMQFAFAVAQWLQEGNHGLSAEAQESLEVAVQCLESAFGFELQDEESVAKYSIAPRSAEQVFEAGLKAPTTTEKPKPTISAEEVKEAEALKTRGNEHLKQKEYESAIRAYTDAIALNPNNAVYYVNRAAVYTCLNKLDEAIADCKMGISVDSKYAKSYSRLGNCYFSKGNFEQSAAAYRSAIELDPYNNIYIDSLKAAEEKCKSSTASSSQPSATASPAPSSQSAMPDMSALLNNPNLMSMAQQFMSNPAMMSMAQNLMQQSGGQMPNLQQMMSDPAVMEMAAKMKQSGNLDPK